MARPTGNHTYGGDDEPAACTVGLGSRFISLPLRRGRTHAYARMRLPVAATGPCLAVRSSHGREREGGHGGVGPAQSSSCFHGAACPCWHGSVCFFTPLVTPVLACAVCCGYGLLPVEFIVITVTWCTSMATTTWWFWLPVAVLMVNFVPHSWARMNATYFSPTTTVPPYLEFQFCLAC
jgi:hypothetical protein